jgi:hypothetical protein
MEVGEAIGGLLCGTGEQLVSKAIAHATRVAKVDLTWPSSEIPAGA